MPASHRIIGKFSGDFSSLGAQSLERWRRCRRAANKDRGPCDSLIEEAGRDECTTRERGRHFASEVSLTAMHACEPLKALIL